MWRILVNVLAYHECERSYGNTLSQLPPLQRVYRDSVEVYDTRT